MESKRRLAAGIALLVIWAVGYTWGTWYFFANVQPGGIDFLPRYVVFGAYLRSGLDPYSAQATDLVNEWTYGRPAQPGEDEHRLTYPFYAILLYGPFALIGDYAVSRAIHMVLLQAALFLGLWMTLKVLNWRPRMWLLITLMAWALLNYNEARDVVLAQFAIFGFLSLAGTLYLLARGNDAAAGALLVLATIKPTLVFLVIPFLLLWAVTRQRWRFVLAFVGVLVGLSLLSLLALPNWIGGFVTNVMAYPTYTVGESPVWLLTHEMLPGLGPVGEGILTAGLIGLMLWSWWRAVRPGVDGDSYFHWSLGVTLVVSDLIVPRSATTNYVLLLVPTLWVLACLARHGRRGQAVLLAALLALFVGQWWLHLATVEGINESPLMFLPWPVALGAAVLACAPWLRAETRRAGWWPLSGPRPTPAAADGLTQPAT